MMYENLKPGTVVYTDKKGIPLPDAQQPVPVDNTLGVIYTGTRYKNVITGSNGIAKICFLRNDNFLDTDKMLPELYNNRENCCGCTACYAVCPVCDMLQNKGIGSKGKFGEVYELSHGAIYMEKDEEGFLYPVVDASLCVRCYKCIEVCPIKVVDKANGIEFTPDGRRKSGFLFEG